MIDEPLNASILGRAQDSGLVRIQVHDLRDFTTDRHRVTDDAPYGGSQGMVMKYEPFAAAVHHCRSEGPGRSRVILMSPQGRCLSQALAWELSREKHLVVLCGRYEGVDERVRQGLVDDEISIGDFVLSGGELPALILVDAVVRLIPGALGDPDSSLEDSFTDGTLEGPHYTRPRECDGWVVPELLVSGDHERVRLWRRQQALVRTMVRRPDLFARLYLGEDDRSLLEECEGSRYLVPSPGTGPGRDAGSGEQRGGTGR